MSALLLCASAHAALHLGDAPPNSLGVTRDGQPMTFSSMRGKVVVVSFWATWCGYCMKELPILAGLQQLAVERHLPLQVVVVNDKESRATFIQSARMIHGRLPSLIVSWDRHGSVGRPYDTARGIPVMVMFHRDGTLAHLHVGYDASALDGIVAEINALLAEPSLPVAVAAGSPSPDRQRPMH